MSIVAMSRAFLSLAALQMALHISCSVILYLLYLYSLSKSSRYQAVGSVSRIREELLHRMVDGVLVRHPDRIVAERRRARQDDPLRLVAREMAHDIGEVRRVKDLCARLYVLAHRLGDERQLRHRLEAHDLLVERLDEALLALLTSNIAELRAAVAQILLGLIAVEMLVALLEMDVEPPSGSS